MSTDATRDRRGSLRAADTHGDELDRLRRRIAQLESSVAEWVDRFESSPIPMTVEDWSEVKRIVDGMRARGVESIAEHIREHPEILGTLAPAAKILDVNPACVSVYRAPDRESLLAHFNEPPDISSYNPATGLSDIYVNLVQSFADGQTRVELEGPDTAMDGTPIYVRTTTSIARGRESDWGSVLQTVEDFTRREAAEAEVRRLAVTDPLTGLANRHQFQVTLRESMSAAKRRGEAVGLLLIDLDGFKAVNDEHGHVAGDALLRAVTQRLNAVCRESESLARIGGDEFTVLVSGQGGPALTERPAARLLEAVREPFEVEGTSVNIGLSIGAACYPADASTDLELHHCADVAMYQAKRQGGNRLCRWIDT